MENADVAIEFKGLTKIYSDVKALDNLSFSVQKGELLGFLGANGAGKTTTIKMSCGLLKPSSGTILINGIDITRQPIEAKKIIGLVPDEFNLFEYLSGRETLEFAGRMYGLPKKTARERCQELLSLLNLTDDQNKLISEYSHGMKKKISFGAAIIHNPKVLFLDEPFEGIDAVSSHNLKQVLFELKNQGTTIFFSSHILEVVEKLCTKVAIINKGLLVGIGTLDELKSKMHTSEGTSLTDIFINLVGAQEEKEKLSWLGS